jgi:hypothetical protein
VSQAHALVGLLGLVLGIVAVIWSAGLLVLRRPPGSLFLGSLVWLVAVISLAAVLGAATALASGPPSDLLHIVYGVLALGVVPGAAFVASGRPERQQVIVATVAAVILAILLFRLLQTGG